MTSTLYAIDTQKLKNYRYQIKHSVQFEKKIKTRIRAIWKEKGENQSFLARFMRYGKKRKKKTKLLRGIHAIWEDNIKTQATELINWGR